VARATLGELPPKRAKVSYQAYFGNKVLGVIFAPAHAAPSFFIDN
jgi:hypothetical protein